MSFLLKNRKPTLRSVNYFFFCEEKRKKECYPSLNMTYTDREEEKKMPLRSLWNGGFATIHLMSVGLLRFNKIIKAIYLNIEN